MASGFLNEIKTTYRFSDIDDEPLGILPLIQDYERIPIVSLEDAVKPIKSLIPDIGRMIWIVKQNCQQNEDELTLKSVNFYIRFSQYPPKSIERTLKSL